MREKIDYIQALLQWQSADPELRQGHAASLGSTGVGCVSCSLVPWPAPRERGEVSKCRKQYRGNRERERGREYRRRSNSWDGGAGWCQFVEETTLGWDRDHRDWVEEREGSLHFGYAATSVPVPVPLYRTWSTIFRSIWPDRAELRKNQPRK